MIYRRKNVQIKIKYEKKFDLVGIVNFLIFQFT